MASIKSTPMDSADFWQNTNVKSKHCYISLGFTEYIITVCWQMTSLSDTFKSDVVFTTSITQCI